MRPASLALALWLAAGCATAPKADKGIELRMQLGRSLMAHREWAAAAAPLREVLAARPQDAEAHALLGTSFREQGLFEQAEAEYQEALRLDPRRADAWSGMGVLRDVRGDEGDRALDDLRRAISLQPEVAAHHNNLGFALYTRGKYTEAVTAYREGLRRDPAARRTRNNLGFAYARLGHYSRARREFSRGGSEAEAANNLGLAYVQAGETATGCDLFREALRLDAKLEVAAANLERRCSQTSTTAPGTAAAAAVVTHPPSEKDAGRKP